MAENGLTGISQNTLDSLLRSGQDTSFDTSMFNSRKVDALVNPYSSLTSAQFQPMQLTPQNAPNTSQQNRELSNAVFGLNTQSANTQQQAILNNQQRQVQDLAQQAKDSQSVMLTQFGQGAFLSSGDSSRNFSTLTDVNTKLRTAVNDITSRSLELLNQNNLNFQTSNVQALGQARQLDFADRQQQFSEDIARGQETGNLFASGQDTGRRTLQGQGFDFNVETTVAGLTGNFRGDRTLQGRITDTQLISNRINQALALEASRGYQTDLSGLSNTDNNFDPSKPLIDKDGKPINTMARADYLAYDVPIKALQAATADIAARASLPRAQIEAELSQFKASKVENDYVQKYYSDLFSGNNDLMNAFTSSESLMQAYLKNPTTDNYKAFMDSYQKSISVAGTDNGMYYDIKAIPDTKNRTIKYSINANNEGLETYGYNGNARFESTNPEINKGLLETRKALTENFRDNIITSGDTPSYINKIFFNSENPTDSESNNKTLFALRSHDKDSKPTGGYNFYELNTSKLSPTDLDAFNGALKEGQLRQADGKVTSTGNKDLATMMKVMDDFKSKGLQVTNMDTNSFFERLDQYKVGNRQVLDGVTNKQVMGMLLLGAQPAGVGTYLKDPKFVEFNNTFTSLSDAVKTINDTARQTGNPNNVDTDQAIRDLRKTKLENGVGTITLKDRAGNPINVAGKPFTVSVPIGDELNLVSNLTQWYKQFGANQNLADDTLKGVLQGVGGVDSSFLNKPNDNGTVWGASVLDFFKVGV